MKTETATYMTWVSSVLTAQVGILRQLLLDGFGGVEGKVESRPAKHLRSFLGQIVNSTFTTQGETAGAQAWSSFDTYCAPFIRYDNMTYEQVKTVPSGVRF